MEYDRINKLLGRQQEKLTKFVTRNLIKVNDSSRGTNDDDLCDYCDAYVLVKGTITLAGDDENRGNRKIILKNNAPFISCTSKINNELIENAEDLDIVMPMYNLLKYSKNYRKTTGSLFNYYRDELTDDANTNVDVGQNGTVPNNNVISSEPFKFRNSIIGNTDAIADYNTGTKTVEIPVPLKYLGNFWRSLNMLLINCEGSLALTWDKNCVITDFTHKRENPGVNPPAFDDSPTGATLVINDCKLCVPVVTLPRDESNELLNNLKSGFKRVITWNKYLSQMSNQSPNNSQNFLVDPTFTNVNRLFVLSFENNENNSRTSFKTFYLPKVQIKDFNVMIDERPFFHQPVKNEEEAYDKLIEITRNNEYKTGNLLDYEYFKKLYRLIAIDLSRQH